MWNRSIGFPCMPEVIKYTHVGVYSLLSANQSCDHYWTKTDKRSVHWSVRQFLKRSYRFWNWSWICLTSFEHSLLWLQKCGVISCYCSPLTSPRNVTIFLSASTLCLPLFPSQLCVLQMFVPLLLCGKSHAWCWGSEQAHPLPFVDCTA